MRAHHVHENRHVEQNPNDTLPRLLADVLPLPLLFASLLAAFPLAFGFPAPWWVAAGLVWYAWFAVLGRVLGPREGAGRG